MNEKKSIFRFLSTQSFGEFIKGVFVRLISGMAIAFAIMYIWLGSEYVISLLNRPGSGFYVVTSVYLGASIFLWIIARKKF